MLMCVRVCARECVCVCLQCLQVFAGSMGNILLGAAFRSEALGSFIWSLAQAPSTPSPKNRSHSLVKILSEGADGIGLLLPCWGYTQNDHS